MVLLRYYSHLTVTKNDDNHYYHDYYDNHYFHDYYDNHYYHYYHSNNYEDNHDIYDMES